MGFPVAFSMPMTKGQRGYWKQVSGDEVYHEAIRFLFRTAPGDIPYHREIGFNANGLIFENLRSAKFALVPRALSKAVSALMPDMRVVAVESTEQKRDDGATWILYDVTWERANGARGRTSVATRKPMD
jgi:phage baseplate assembly protein W